MPSSRPDIIERIAALREQGTPLAAIAAAIGLSRSSVCAHCLTYGIEDLGAATRRMPPVPETPVEHRRRDGIVIRRFTIAEDRRLLALEAHGLSYSQIARALRRPRNSVTGRLATLARRDERLMGA